MLGNKREAGVEIDLENQNGPDSSHSRNIFNKITQLINYLMK